VGFLQAAQSDIRSSPRAAALILGFIRSAGIHHKQHVWSGGQRDDFWNVAERNEVSIRTATVDITPSLHVR